MSWECWNVNGYGIDETPIDKVSMEKLFEFVKNHRKCAEIQRYFQEEIDIGSIDLDDFEEAIDDYETEEGHIGFGGIIAEVMSEETGVPLSYLRDENDHYGIVFFAQYPWNYNYDFLRNLTKEKLFKSFKEYFAELGVEISEKDLNEQTFEFCG